MNPTHKQGTSLFPLLSDYSFYKQLHCQHRGTRNRLEQHTYISILGQMQGVLLKQIF